VDDSTAFFGVRYRDCSRQSRMNAYRCRYYLNRYSRLLADFGQKNKLVVHYLCASYATMQNRFGKHYRNHR